MDDITINPPALAEQAAEALTAAAAFLREHPDLPTGNLDALDYHAFAGTDEQQRAEVDRIAAILGVTAEENADGDHYAARRVFGPGVTYQATAIDQSRMKRYKAHMAPYLAPTAPAQDGTAAA